MKLGDSSDNTDSKIVAISGATVSSEAVVAIINTFLGQIRNHLQEKGLPERLAMDEAEQATMMADDVALLTFAHTWIKWALFGKALSK